MFTIAKHKKRDTIFYRRKKTSASTLVFLDLNLFVVS